MRFPSSSERRSLPPEPDCQSNVAGGGRDRWRSGEGGGLGVAGSQFASIYMCLYILWWIYDQTKHGRQLQMEGRGSRRSICLSSTRLWAVRNQTRRLELGRFSAKWRVGSLSPCGFYIGIVLKKDRLFQCKKQVYIHLVILKTLVWLSEPTPRKFWLIRSHVQYR